MKIFTILAFLFRARWKRLLQFRHLPALAGRAIFAATILLYGLGAGYLLRQSEIAERVNLPSFLLALNLSVAALTFLKSYFPSYQPLSRPVLAFYPLGRWQKVLLSALTDFFSLFTVTFTFFYIAMFSAAFPRLTLGDAGLSAAIFVAALALDRSLRFAIEYALNFRRLYGVLSLAGVAALFGSAQAARATGVSVEFFISGVFAYAMILHAYGAWKTAQRGVEERAVFRVLSRSAAGASVAGYIARAVSRSGHIVILFVLALILKCIMFIIAFDREGFGGSGGFIGFFFQSFCIAPVAWFTYIANNAFGVYWQLWQATRQTGSALGRALFLYTHFAVTFLCADAVLTTLVLVWKDALTIERAALWLWCALAFFAAGFITSATMPVKLERLEANIFFSLRGVTSSIASLLTFVVFFGVVAVSQAHYALGGVIAGLSVALAFALSSNRRTLWYNTYSKIHR